MILSSLGEKRIGRAEENWEGRRELGGQKRMGSARYILGICDPRSTRGALRIPLSARKSGYLERTEE